MNPLVNLNLIIIFINTHAQIYTHTRAELSSCVEFTKVHIPQGTTLQIHQEQHREPGTFFTRQKGFNHCGLLVNCLLYLLVISPVLFRVLHMYLALLRVYMINYWT